jgi:hydroxyacylglutathione hydrolase
VSSQPKAIIDSLRIGPEKNFTYLIACAKTGDAGLIDPSFDFDRVIEWAKKHSDKIKIKYLIATHGHWDHAGGFPEMLKRIPDAQVVCHEAEVQRLKNAKIPCHVALKDGEEFKIGEISVKGLHTPGHTEGGCCYLVEDQCFSGDTLFVGQCGRTDLEGGSDEKLFTSLNKLKNLPAETLVRPGHDYGVTPTSTIERESRTNPTMLATSLIAFRNLP